MGRLLLPRADRELLAMSQIVIDSDLEWTIARFTRPTDGPAKGSVRAGFLGRDKIGSAITGPTSPRSCSSSSATLASSGPRLPSATEPTEKGPER